MKILWTNSGTYALADVVDLDALIVKDCGFVFDSVSGTWQTADIESVVRLRSKSLKLSSRLTISELALQHYKAAGQKVLTAVEESRAGDTDIEIPAPKGLAYLPFQKAGIVYVVRHLRDTL